jgi:hypothetical protein
MAWHAHSAPREEQEKAMQLGEHLDALKAWAAPKGLDIIVSDSTQQEPDYVVSIREPGALSAASLVSRRSRDSVDVAAMYLVNTLDRLGVDSSRKGANG